jgi:hypothetical protein
MISLDVIAEDDYIVLSSDARALYPVMVATADDDGMVGGMLGILRAHGLPEASLDELVKSGYVLRHESGVCVVAHWHIMNAIEPTKYRQTIHNDVLQMLDVKSDEKGRIMPRNGNVYLLSRNSLESVQKVSTQVSIEQVSIDKDSFDEVKPDQSRLGEGGEPTKTR